MRAAIASRIRGRCGRSACRNRCVIARLDPGTILDWRGHGFGLWHAPFRRRDRYRFDLRNVRLVTVDADQPDRADGDQCNEAGEFHGVPTPMRRPILPQPLHLASGNSSHSTVGIAGLTLRVQVSS